MMSGWLWLTAFTLGMTPVSYTVPGGMRVVEVRTGARTAAAVITLDTGLRDDRTSPWVTHVTLAGLLAGGPTEKPFHALAYAQGAELRVDIGVASTTILVSCNPAVMKSLLPELLQRLFSRPRPTPRPADLARWRPLAAQLDLSGADLTDTQLVELVASTAVSDRGLSRTSDLEKLDLDTVDAGAVARRMNTLVVPANASLAVAGNLDTLDVRALVERFHHGSARPALTATMESPREYETAHFMELHIYAYRLSLGNAHQVHVAEVARGILRDRITRALRAQGLAYSPQVLVVKKDWLDMLVMVLPIRPSALGTVSTLLEAELGKLMTGGVAEEEVVRHLSAARLHTTLIEEKPGELALRAAALARLPDVDEALRPPATPVTASEIQRLLEGALARDRRVAIRFSREALLHFLQMRSQGTGVGRGRTRR